jgi:hypothetical protein
MSTKHGKPHPQALGDRPDVSYVNNMSMPDILNHMYELSDEIIRTTTMTAAMCIRAPECVTVDSPTSEQLVGLQLSYCPAFCLIDARALLQLIRTSADVRENTNRLLTMVNILVDQVSQLIFKRTYENITGNTTPPMIKISLICVINRWSNYTWMHEKIWIEIVTFLITCPYVHINRQNEFARILSTFKRLATQCDYNASLMYTYSSVVVMYYQRIANDVTRINDPDILKFDGIDLRHLNWAHQTNHRISDLENGCEPVPRLMDKYLKNPMRKKKKGKRYR